MRVAACIDTISASCPLLRTFALHILPEECPADGCEVTNILQAPSQYSQSRHTISALRDLKVRDTFVIVAENWEPLDYTEARDTIAPFADWQVLKLKAWPAISLTEQESKVIATVGGPDYDEKDLPVEMWCFQPKTSKAFGLPEYLRIEAMLSCSAHTTSCNDGLEKIGSRSNSVEVIDSDEE